MGWLVIEGDNGINEIFKTNKHRRDDALVPFKTKGDNNLYEDFSGVVGAFSRLMSDTSLKGKVNKSLLFESVREKVSECDDQNYEILFRIIENIYFENDKIYPINIQALNYVDSNTTQRQVAEFIYSLFVEDTDLKEKYSCLKDSEDTNVLEQLVYTSLQDSDERSRSAVEHADCFLPYVKEVFYKDFSILLENSDYYRNYISRFLAYYYLFYVSQLAVKLSKFDKGDRETIEPIYMALKWEGTISRVRHAYEHGWKYVKEKLGHMFSHAVVLEMMSHNTDNVHLDYIGLFDRMNGSPEDENTSEDVYNICEKYKEWIPIDYSNCRHDEQKDGECKTSNSVRRLFDLVDFQFINGQRTSHYRAYNKKFIEFTQKNFGKLCGANGYILSLSENDIIMFTQIVLKQNDGKIRLSKLISEFEKRGILLDRESKRQLVELFEKMNLLEKRSDSGDAQYVKSVL